MFDPEACGRAVAVAAAAVEEATILFGRGGGGGRTYTYQLTYGESFLGRRVNPEWYRLQSPAESYRQRSETDGKGRKLLLSLLTGEQQQQLDSDGSFLVTGSMNGLYKIYCGSITFNVTRLHRRTKQKLYTLCAGPYGVTYNDFWLAQKLMIEADEKAFLK